MLVKRPNAAASASANAKSKHARETDVADRTKKPEAAPAIQAFLGAGADPITFEYTAEQWAEIARSIQQLHAKPEAIERARRELKTSARSFLWEVVNKARNKHNRKRLLWHWVRAGKLADALMAELTWFARNNVHPTSASGKPFAEELDALTTVSVMAGKCTVTLRGKFDDGDPKATSKTRYNSRVLDVWTKLGGKLKFSRHPRTGKVKGPLARYFSAVTQPVHGGSPESLPDIIKRHLARRAALDKYRLARAIAKPRLNGKSITSD